MSRIPRRAGLPSARSVALIAIGLTWAAARLPVLGGEERAALAARFSFTRLPLAEWSQGERRERRTVNPSVEHIAGWISAVGAAVALADLDGNGLANDACHVDPRTDPSPWRPRRGRERATRRSCSSRGLPYDASTMAPMGCLPERSERGRPTGSARLLLGPHAGRVPAPDRAAGPLRPSSSPRARSFPSGALVHERRHLRRRRRRRAPGSGHRQLLPGRHRVLDAQATEPVSMQHSMSRAANGGRNRVFCWWARDRGDRTSPSRRRAALFPERAEHGWTLAVGAADLDGDLLPELYFANDFGPDRLLAQPLAAGPAALRAARGRAPPHRSPLEGARPGLVQGNGRRLRRPERRRPARHLRQQHRRGVRAEESNFAVRLHRRLEAMQRGVAPYDDESEALGLARSGLGLGRAPRRLRQRRRARGAPGTGFVARRATTAGPSCRSWRSATTGCSRCPAVAALPAGDELSGHDANPFYVRAADGRYHDVASRPRSRRAVRHARHRDGRRRRGRRSRLRGGQPVAAVVPVPQRRRRRVRPVARPAAAAARRRPPDAGRPAIGARCASSARMASCSSARSTAATAIPASAAPSCTSASATARRRPR